MLLQQAIKGRKMGQSKALFENWIANTHKKRGTIFSRGTSKVCPIRPKEKISCTDVKRQQGGVTIANALKARGEKATGSRFWEKKVKRREAKMIYTRLISAAQHRGAKSGTVKEGSGIMRTRKSLNKEKMGGKGRKTRSGTFGQSASCTGCRGKKRIGREYWECD